MLADCMVCTVMYNHNKQVPCYLPSTHETWCTTTKHRSPATYPAHMKRDVQPQYTGLWLPTQHTWNVMYNHKTQVPCYLPSTHETWCTTTIHRTLATCPSHMKRDVQPHMSPATYPAHMKRDVQPQNTGPLLPTQHTWNVMYNHNTQDSGYLPSTHETWCTTTKHRSPATYPAHMKRDVQPQYTGLWLPAHHTWNVMYNHTCPLLPTQHTWNVMYNHKTQVPCYLPSTHETWCTATINRSPATYPAHMTRDVQPQCTGPLLTTRHTWNVMYNHKTQVPWYLPSTHETWCTTTIHRTLATYPAHMNRDVQPQNTGPLLPTQHTWNVMYNHNTQDSGYLPITHETWCTTTHVPCYLPSTHETWCTTTKHRSPATYPAHMKRDVQPQYTGLWLPAHHTWNVMYNHTCPLLPAQHTWNVMYNHKTQVPC